MEGTTESTKRKANRSNSRETETFSSYVDYFYNYTGPLVTNLIFVILDRHEVFKGYIKIPWKKYYIVKAFMAYKSSVITIT